MYLQLVILGAALGLGQWLEKKKVSWLGDAGVALLLGVLVGILSRVFTFSKTYISWMGFQVPPPLSRTPSNICGPCTAAAGAVSAAERAGLAVTSTFQLSNAPAADHHLFVKGLLSW